MAEKLPHLCCSSYTKYFLYCCHIGRITEVDTFPTREDVLSFSTCVRKKLKKGRELLLVHLFGFFTHTYFVWEVPPSTLREIVDTFGIRIKFKFACQWIFYSYIHQFEASHYKRKFVGELSTIQGKCHIYCPTLRYF